MDTDDKSATKRTHSEASLPVEPLTVKQSKLDDTLRQIDPSLYGVDVKATSKDPKLVKELALSPGEELSTFGYEGLAGLLVPLSKAVNAPRRLEGKSYVTLRSTLKESPALVEKVRENLTTLSELMKLGKLTSW